MSAHGDDTIHRHHILEAEREALRAELHARDVLIAQLRRDLADARAQLLVAGVTMTLPVAPRRPIDHVWPVPDAVQGTVEVYNPATDPPDFVRGNRTSAPPENGDAPILNRWIAGPGATLDDPYEILPGYAASDD